VSELADVVELLSRALKLYERFGIEADMYADRLPERIAYIATSDGGRLRFGVGELLEAVNDHYRDELAELLTDPGVR
jgi:hypothetical protein